VRAPMKDAPRYFTIILVNYEVFSDVQLRRHIFSILALTY